MKCKYAHLRVGVRLIIGTLRQDSRLCEYTSFNSTDFAKGMALPVPVNVLQELGAGCQGEVMATLQTGENCKM